VFWTGFIIESLQNVDLRIIIDGHHMSRDDSNADLTNVGTYVIMNYRVDKITVKQRRGLREET